MYGLEISSGFSSVPSLKCVNGRPPADRATHFESTNSGRATRTKDGLPPDDDPTGGHGKTKKSKNLLSHIPSDVSYSIALFEQSDRSPIQHWQYKIQNYYPTNKSDNINIQITQHNARSRARRSGRHSVWMGHNFDLLSVITQTQLWSDVKRNESSECL